MSEVAPALPDYDNPLEKVEKAELAEVKDNADTKTDTVADVKAYQTASKGVVDKLKTDGHLIEGTHQGLLKKIEELTQIQTKEKTVKVHGAMKNMIQGDAEFASDHIISSQLPKDGFELGKEGKSQAEIQKAVETSMFAFLVNKNINSASLKKHISGKVDGAFKAYSGALDGAILVANDKGELTILDNIARDEKVQAKNAEEAKTTFMEKIKTSPPELKIEDIKEFHSQAQYRLTGNYMVDSGGALKMYTVDNNGKSQVQTIDAEAQIKAEYKAMGITDGVENIITTLKTQKDKFIASNGEICENAKDAEATGEYLLNKEEARKNELILNKNVTN